jgi:hypothetical protein
MFMCLSVEPREAISHRLPFVPRRRSPSKPNGARLRPASHYGKALRAFDRIARSASVFQRQRDCHSGGLIAERTDHDRQENMDETPSSRLDGTNRHVETSIEMQQHRVELS